MKTSELTGPALNWAVSTCEGFKGNPEWVSRQSIASTDWAQGGPIIARERITVDAREHGTLWVAHSRLVGQDGIKGPTPLIAAMRCYVASKLGDEIEIPGAFK
jgi:hypothetical protein